MRKRVLLTIGIIILLKLAFLIPVPGVDGSAMKTFMERIMMGKTTPFGPWEHGPFKKVSIFSLGMMPFVSSCLLLQLISIVTPPLRRQLFGGESGRAEMRQYTYILTISLSIIQSFMLSTLIQNPNYFAGIAMVREPGVMFQITSTLSMTAAVVLMIFLAEMINRHGVGNGYAWMIISPIFFDFAVYCHRFYLVLTDVEVARRISMPTVLLIGLLASGLIYGTYYVYNRVTQLRLKQGALEAGVISFRPTIVGREPISYASIALVVPFLLKLFDKSYPVYLIYFVLAIFALTYLYSRIVYNQNPLLDQIQRFGFSTDKNELLSFKVNENLKIAAIFLISVFVLPDLLEEHVGWSELGGKSSMAFRLIPHFTVVLFTAFILDTLHQLDFFKQKQDSNSKNWSVCYTAFTEIEAQIKSLYLKNHGINSLTEPLRFSWGVPIRTIIDQYRIYTPADKTAHARALILKAEAGTP